MIGGLTNYGQLKVLNAIKGGRSLGAPASNWYVAAFSTNPVAGGFGGTEANYPGYARVTKNNGSDWAAPTGSGGTITSANATEIDFPAGATGANQVLTGIGLFDATQATLGGGNCWAFWSIPAGQQPTIGVGTVYQIPIGNLILEFLCGATMGYTDYAAKKILNAILGNVAIGQPASYYLGAFTATPGPTGGGTESARASYARQPLAVGQGASNWLATLTPTKAQVKTAAGTTGATSAITMNSASVVGNLMVLTVMWSGATTLSSITDNASNTWKILTTQTGAASNNIAVCVCRSIATAVTLTITATFSASTTTPWFGAAEWANAQDVDYNSLTKTTLATTTAPSQNMNVSVSGEVIVACIYAAASATSITTTAGWTLEGSNGNQQSFSELVLSNSATDNAAYAAAPVTFGATTTAAIITFGLIPASTATLAQSQSQWGPAVNFPTLGGTGSENWTSWGLLDIATLGSGNLWLFGQLASSLTVSSGSVPQFPANSVAGILVSSTS